MKKSILLGVMLLASAGCGDDGTGPEPSVHANLVIEFEPWDADDQERRLVKVSVIREVSDIKYFDDLPQDGIVTVRPVLPCSGDLLADKIWLEVKGRSVSSSTYLDGFACTEDEQVVSEWDRVITGPSGPVCINPDNWLGDC